ncbi:MAG: hypothetical protein Q8N05_12855 [Bacteroidota bacterium]|nr:hypothetical protein [Bacteroidota bacterium]
MKTNEDLQRDLQDTIQWEQLSGTKETSLIEKVGKNLKRIIFLTCLAGMGIFFFSCAPSYVATQPAYVEYQRPAQPSSLHIWIDGDWRYRRQNHSYEQRNGYWEKPNQGRTYVSGHWQSTPRGQYWVAGRWQRHDRQRYNDNHNR